MCVGGWVGARVWGVRCEGVVVVVLGALSEVRARRSLAQASCCEGPALPRVMSSDHTTLR